MRRAPAAVVIAIACLGGAACGPDLPERLWRSEHVRYFSRGSDDAVCPALLGEIEEHSQVIGDALGIERPLVTYYKYADAADFAANGGCGAGASACGRNATVNSTAGFDRHELIHAYLDPYGLPPRLFIEGAAVALSCQHYPRPTGSWRDALTADRFSPQLYGAGGWLVGYVMRMFRKTWFVNLYGSLQINATADEIAAVFEDIYDMPLDEVWTAAITAKQAPMLCPWECGRPAFEADGQPHALATACDGGTTQRAVDVTGEGVTRWLMDGDASFTVGSCTGDDVPLHAISGGNGTGALLAPLTSGRFFIDATVAKGAAPTLSIDTDALPSLSSFDCAAGTAVPDDLSRYDNLTLFFPGSAGSQFASFANGTTRDAVVLFTSDDPSATGSVCDGCAGSCTTVGAGTGLGAATPSGTTLMIPAGPAITANVIWTGPPNADGGAPPDGGI
jgi:hypothetical protein